MLGALRAPVRAACSSLHKRHLSAQPAALPPWAVLSPAQTETLVVLIGWLGCRATHLNRYAALYQRRGLATLELRVPLVASLVPSAATRASTAFLAANPGSLLGPGQRTLLHVASNGGFLFLSQLLAAREDETEAVTLLDHARGLLLDCTPASSRPPLLPRRSPPSPDSARRSRQGLCSQPQQRPTCSCQQRRPAWPNSTLCGARCRRCRCPPPACTTMPTR